LGSLNDVNRSYRSEPSNTNHKRGIAKWYGVDHVFVKVPTDEMIYS